MDAGEAEAGALAGGEFELAFDLGESGWRDFRGNQALSAIDEDAGGAALGIAEDLAAGGIGGVVGDAGE